MRSYRPSEGMRRTRPRNRGEERSTGIIRVDVHVMFFVSAPIHFLFSLPSRSTLALCSLAQHINSFQCSPRAREVWRTDMLARFVQCIVVLLMQSSMFFQYFRCRCTFASPHWLHLGKSVNDFFTLSDDTITLLIARLLRMPFHIR